MKISFTLNKMEIQRTDKNVVAAGSKNYVFARFSMMSGDWTNPITAIFGSYTQILDENGECVVPWEVLENPGSFEVSAFCGDLHTANTAIVKVEKTGYKEGETPKDPTPDAYRQYIKQVQSIVDKAVPPDGTPGYVLGATEDGNAWVPQTGGGGGSGGIITDDDNGTVYDAAVHIQDGYPVLILTERSADNG